MLATKKLIKHYGGKREVAQALHIHEETFRLWVRDGIPLGKAIDVEQKSEGTVTAEQILVEAKKSKRLARRNP